MLGERLAARGQRLGACVAGFAPPRDDGDEPRDEGDEPRGEDDEPPRPPPDEDGALERLLRCRAE